MFGDRELLQQTIGLVMLGFSMHTSSTGLAIFLDKFLESRSSVVPKDKACSFVLTRVSGENVIVLVSEYAESEIVRVGDVDTIMMSEEVVGANGPIRFRIF